MAKKRKGTRIEDVSATAFRPLNHEELRSLRLFIVGEGCIQIERQLLGRLLLDRERLVFVADAAEFWRQQRSRVSCLLARAQECTGLERDAYREEAARETARADTLLAHAMGQLDGAGGAAIVTDATGIRLHFKPCKNPTQETTRRASDSPVRKTKSTSTS